MAVILPDNHPAIAILQDEKCNVIPTSQAPKNNVVRVAVVNTMSNVVETETQFARAFAESNLDVELVFYSPSTKIEAAPQKLAAANQDAKIIAKEQHRLKYHQPLNEIQNDSTINGIVLTGFPGANLELRQKTGPTDNKGNDFYDEFTALLDYARSNNAPTLATCWAAHVALNHFYGIERLERNAKLTGIFELAVTNTESPLVKGIAANFSMPISRYYYSDEQTLNAEPNLDVLADSPETGAAIVSEKKGSFIYMSGHLEYLADTLPEEYIRDIWSKGIIDAPFPRNVNLDNPQYTWGGANKAFYTNITHFFNTARQHGVQATTQPTQSTNQRQGSKTTPLIAAHQ